MKVIIAEDSRPSWQQPFRGLHWFDMPGNGDLERKANFSLFRRGLYDPEMEVVEADAVVLRVLGDGEEMESTRSGKRVVRKRGRASKSHRVGTVLGLARAMAERSVRYPELAVRQQALMGRLELLTPAQIGLIRRHVSVAVESAILRALGRYQGRPAVRSMSAQTMDGIEQALKEMAQLEVDLEAEKVAMRARCEAKQKELRMRYLALKEARVKNLWRRLCSEARVGGQALVALLREGVALSEGTLKNLEAGLRFVERGVGRKSEWERRVA